MARELCGDNLDNCILLWGWGSSNPSFGKGYASGPNKMFYRFLGETLGIRLILVDETFSSRSSPCCQDEEIYHPQLSDPFGNLTEELYRTSCCMACSNMWNRDVAACINIFHMFLDVHNLFNLIVIVQIPLTEMVIAGQLMYSFNNIFL